ncbi:MAG: lysyl oxidase family protein, partial [Rubrobacteraceae bacterium]
NHWHFFRFMRYELRDLDGELAARDQKTGFCVGDRYDADPDVRMEGEPEPPGVFDIAPEGDWCAEDDPDRDELAMGLSVGYGDNYEALLEGQSIDVTDLPSGRYVLVNRVNADLEETDESNNAASLLIELDTSKENPAVSVLESCPNGERCG